MNKKGSGTKKDFSIKINAVEKVTKSGKINTNPKSIRVGKIHIDLLDYVGKINQTITLILKDQLYKGTSISLNISIGEED